MIIPITIFCITSTILYFSYPLVDIVACKRNEKFSKLAIYKRYYIIKNIIKGFSLTIITLFGTYFLVVPIILNNKWNTKLNHRFAMLYCSNDFIGLLRVRLPINTKIHHIITTLFGFISLYFDYNEFSIVRLLFVYTLLSSYAYLVNIYLGLRFIAKFNYIRILAFIVYLVACSINWSYHIYFYIVNFNRLNIYFGIYAIIILLIVYDDLILLSWLYKNSLKSK